jgi:NADPH:quinone reductase
VTAGSAAKCAACRQLGADLAIDYKSQDFVAVIDQVTAGRGVDVVLDMVGGDYVGRSLQIMAQGARHISIGIMTTPDATVSMPQIIMKRLTLTGSTLRRRSPAEKGAIAESLRQRFWPLIEQGKLKPVVHRSFPLAQAADAHRALEAGDHIGKIVLTTNLLAATA